MAHFPDEIFPITLLRMTRYHCVMNIFPGLIIQWQTNEMEGRRDFSHLRTGCHKVGEINQNQKFSLLSFLSKEYFGMLNLHDILTGKKEIPFHLQSENTKRLISNEYLLYSMLLWTQMLINLPDNSILSIVPCHYYCHLLVLNLSVDQGG